MGKTKHHGHADHLFIYQRGEIKTADVVHLSSRNVDENGDSIFGISRGKDPTAMEPVLWLQISTWTDSHGVYGRD